jgi:hypothetical protein
MSSGLVLSFLHRRSISNDWNQHELAEFYRVESVLVQGGLSVTTDRGISDEGDPWFLFCRADNEEVIAHFARIDGEYLIVSNFHSGIARGRDFRRLIRQMIESHPLMLPIKRNQNQKIFLHPAALLAAMLASAYFLSNEKDATSGNGSHDNTKKDSISFLLGEKFGILAAASLAAIWIEHQADTVFKLLENTVSLHGSAPSDEKIGVEAGHDFASLDATIMQTVRDIESGAHRIDLSDANLAIPQDGNDHQYVQGLLAKQSNSEVANGPGGINSNLAQAPSATASNDYAATTHANSIPGDTDSAIVSANLPPPVVLVNVASAFSTTTPSTPLAPASSSVDPIVATSEAVVRLAVTDSISPSIQPVVLSSSAVAVSSALEQASAEVGFEASLPQSSTAIAVNSAESDVAPTLNQIMHTVEAFLRNTPSYEITVSGSNVVVVDTKLSDASSPNFGVVSWDLHNGSTLSIVGIIPHHHAAATA